MATNAAHHALAVIESVETIVAIELLAAAQGIDFRREQLGPPPAWARGGDRFEIVRREIPFLEPINPSPRSSSGRGSSSPRGRCSRRRRGVGERSLVPAVGGEA